MVTKGSGWHGEPRRHAEAVKKGLGTRYGRPKTTTKRALKKQPTKPNTLFEYKNIIKTKKQLYDGLKLKFPFVSVTSSTLGGEDRVTIFVTISKDPKNTWVNDILENSRYARISIERGGVVEHFSGWGLKLRKFKGKDINHIIEKISAIKVTKPMGS